MNIHTLKSEHKELFDNVFAEGVAAEKDRVCSWLTFYKGNSELIIEAINSDKNLSPIEMVKLGKNTVNKTREIEAFEAAVMAQINLPH